MATLTAAHLRGYARDLRTANPGSDRADTFASAMEARADLLDAEKGTTSGIAQDAALTQEIPLLGKITIRGGAARGD